jgi:hypothetical protein
MENSEAPGVANAHESGESKVVAAVAAGSTLQRYRVHGIAMIPIEAEMEIEAASPSDAIAQAQAKFRARPRDFLLYNSQDEGAAHDWRPDAVPVSNDPGQPRET